MKIFSKDLPSARQGDVYIIRAKAIPDGVRQAVPVDGKYIVAHSETGHHHVIEATPNVKYFTTDNPIVSYLQVIEATEKSEAILEHLRNFDTHDSIVLTDDIYCLVNGRESAPEGWVRAAD